MACPGQSRRGWGGRAHSAHRHPFPGARRTDAGRGIKAKSPHDMLQAFLNASSADRWALLSNGILLRLLRDYYHTFSKGYIQFDLESIFETRN